MLNIEFQLVWFDTLSEWRVIGSGGHYVGAKSISEIPTAVRTMMQSEADAVLRFLEKQ